MGEAHHFLTKGHASGMRKSDYVSAEDRKERLKKLSENLEGKIKAHIPRSRNLDLVILKCHLIIEYMFDEFIDLMAPTEGGTRNERFTFKQKESLVHMLGFPADPAFFPSIDMFNKLRNQVAHTLEVDRATIDDLIRINSENPQDVKDLDDTERAKAIKQITKFICFMMLGVIEGMHAVEFAAHVQHAASPDT